MSACEVCGAPLPKPPLVLARPQAQPQARKATPPRKVTPTPHAPSVVASLVAPASVGRSSKLAQAVGGPSAQKLAASPAASGTLKPKKASSEPVVIDSDGLPAASTPSTADEFHPAPSAQRYTISGS